MAEAEPQAGRAKRVVFSVRVGGTRVAEAQPINRESLELGGVAVAVHQYAEVEFSAVLERRCRRKLAVADPISAAVLGIVIVLDIDNRCMV